MSLQTSGQSSAETSNKRDYNADGVWRSRRVLIVGAFGVGAAAALAFDQKGATLAVIGSSKEQLKPLIGQLHKGYAVVGDISSISGVTRAIGEAAWRLGGIDVLVLNDRLPSDKKGNVGLCRHISLEESSAGDGSGTAAPPTSAIAAAVRQHLHSTSDLVKAAGPHLTKSHGRIVDVVSLSGVLAGGAATTSSYAVLAKHAQDNLMCTLARQLAPHGVHINSVLLGGELTAHNSSGGDAAELFPPSDASSEEGDLDMPPESPPSSDDDKLCAKEQRQQASRAIMFLSSPTAVQGACLAVPAGGLV